MLRCALLVCVDCGSVLHGLLLLHAREPPLGLCRLSRLLAKCCATELLMRLCAVHAGMVEREPPLNTQSISCIVYATDMLILQNTRHEDGLIVYLFIRDTMDNNPIKHPETEIRKRSDRYVS